MGLAAIVGGVALVPLSLAFSLYGKVRAGMPLGPWRRMGRCLHGSPTSAQLRQSAARTAPLDPGHSPAASPRPRRRRQVPLPVTCVLGHAAAAGLAVAAAATTEAGARRTTALLGKDKRSGRISKLSLVAWWPYHLGLQTKLFIQWRKNKGPTGEPLWNKVTPQLYIGGWPKNAEVLPAARDLSVVDVTCELPRTHETGGGYLCLPTWDTHAPDAPAIQSAVDWGLDQMRLGRALYVHCAHGHGRSATVLAAVLIASGQAKGADDAVAVMRAARPKVRLNGKQRAALEAWIDYAAKRS
ncbi:MAG: protein-tyrosine phosphatase-like protein [Monoraphidium minutum]|nr:MAG: protein-tyrosine phosphatase-like protein [Monoraphidium minutum]